MVPTLCVKARDLLKDGRAADVAMPKVYMRIRDWWKGGKCQVGLAMYYPAGMWAAASPSFKVPCAGSASCYYPPYRGTKLIYSRSSRLFSFDTSLLSLRLAPSQLPELPAQLPKPKASPLTQRSRQSASRSTIYLAAYRPFSSSGRGSARLSWWPGKVMTVQSLIIIVLRLL